MSAKLSQSSAPPPEECGAAAAAVNITCALETIDASAADTAVMVTVEGEGMLAGGV